MIRTLKQTKLYFTTTEKEAVDLVEDLKEESTGDVIESQIKQKKHKDFGEYFETKVVEEYTTSKDVIEFGH